MFYWNKRKKGIKILMLGAQGVGKTCLIGGMAALASRPENNSGFKQWLGRNDHTVKYANNLVDELNHQMWPAATAHHQHPLDLTVDYRGTLFNFTVPDYPGEDLLAALTEGEPERFPELDDLLNDADFILLLIGPKELGLEQDRLAQPTQDDGSVSHQSKSSDRAERYRRVQMLLQGTYNACFRNNKSKRLGIVLTQADRYSEGAPLGPAEVEDLLARHLPGFSENVTWKQKPQFFAISAIGERDAEGKPPPELKPFGYTDLFEWIKQERRDELISPVKHIAYSAVVVTALIFTGLFAQSRIHLGTIEQENTSVEEIRRAYEAIWWKRETVNERANQVLDKRIDRIQQEIAEENRIDRLSDLDSYLSSISGIAQLNSSHRVRQLQEEIEQRKEDILYAIVIDAKTSNSSVRHTTEDYLDRFPSGYRAEEVRNIRERAAERRVEADRQVIRNISPTNRRRWERKIEAIDVFIHDHEDALTTRELRNLKSTVSVARRMVGQTLYGVRVRRVEELVHSRWAALTFYRNGERVYKIRSPGRATRPAWNSQEGLVRLRWEPGDELQMDLSLWRRGPLRGYMDGGTLSKSGPLGLSLFDGPVDLNVNDGNRDKFSDGPRVYMEVDGFSSDDWDLLRRYFHPGRWWQ